MLEIGLIEKHLKTRELGRYITYYPFTDSTNEDLWELIAQGGATGGHIVITDEQRQGKGRQGRSWYSAPQLALAFSIFLLPDIRVKQLGLLSLATGIAAVKGLREFGVTAALKWPNDIVVNNLKLGGILIESRLVDEGPLVVIGIGLNINEEETNFPADIYDQAVSARMILGEELSREQLLAGILGFLEEQMDDQLTSVTKEWQEYCAHMDGIVEFNTEGGSQSGRFKGITEDGYAIIDQDGESQIVTAGDLGLSL